MEIEMESIKKNTDQYSALRFLIFSNAFQHPL